MRRCYDLIVCLVALWLLGACGRQTLDLDRASDSNASDPADPSRFLDVRAEFLHSVGERLFWCEGLYDGGDVLWACDKRDCAKTSNAYAPIWPQDLSFSQDFIAYGSGAIGTCSIDGCDVAAATVYQSSNAALPWADGEFVYWRDWGDRSIYRCPSRGCANGPERVVGGQLLDDSFFVAAGQVYWWVEGEARRTDVDGSGAVLRAFSLAGEAKVGVAFGKRLLTTVGQTAYFVDGSTRAVLRCELPDCAVPFEVVATNTEKFDLQADEHGVFWLEKDQALRACATEGCADAPSLVTSEPVFAYTIDVADVYWSEWTDWVPGGRQQYNSTTGQSGLVVTGIRRTPR